MQPCLTELTHAHLVFKSADMFYIRVKDIALTHAGDQHQYNVLQSGTGHVREVSKAKIALVAGIGSVSSVI